MIRLFLPLVLLAAACGGAINAELPTIPLPANELVVAISNGEAVELDAFLDDEKWTLFEYGADW